MKKSNMSLVAFVVMFVVISHASAGEIGVNFDGKTAASFRSVNFGITNTAINNAIPEIPMPKIEMQKFSEQDTDLIPKAEQVEFHLMSVPSSQNVDSAIIDAAKYCEKNKIEMSITENFKKLLIYGTKDEKNEFIPASRYRFPERFNKLRQVEFVNGLPSTKEVGICIKWATTQVCRDKHVWQTACVFGAVVCYVAAGATCGPAGAVCSLINSIVPECVPVPYCVEYGTAQGYPTAIP